MFFIKSSSNFQHKRGFEVILNIIMDMLDAILEAANLVEALECS